MRAILLPAAAVLAAAAAVPAQARMFGPEYHPCGEQPNTIAIVECVDARTKAADRRLNAAYKALQQRIEEGPRQRLVAAQRLWIQYRDANCGFYGSPQGTIWRIHAAECRRSMTEEHARELERAMKLD